MHWIKDITSGRVARMSWKQRIEWLFGLDTPTMRRYQLRKIVNGLIACPCVLLATVMAVLFGDDIAAWLQPILTGGDPYSAWEELTYPLVMAAMLLGIGFSLTIVVRAIVKRAFPNALL